MIDPCNQDDFEAIYAIVNDGAEAYRGIIPEDRWHEPYMSKDELRDEIDSGVEFWGWRDGGELAGVMGIQKVQDVTLIRHAYVRTTRQGQGIGGKLLAELRKLTSRPVLIGTWAAATWAIGFYVKHGFRLVTPVEKDRLLKKYWSIPERQVETSVVLGDERWFTQYNTRLVEADIHPGSIEWSCQCGFRLSIEYTASDSAVGYVLGEFSYCVTGGVGVRCPQCERRYFLPSMANVPSVSELISRP